MIKNFKWLLLVFIFVGVFTVFLIPPFQKPDEGAHYRRLLSAVGLIRGLYTNNSFLYHSELMFPSESFSGIIATHYYSKFPISIYKKLFDGAGDIVPTIFEFNPLIFVSYLPGIIGYCLGFKFYFIAFYLARLSFFLFFTICILWSLRRVNHNYRYLIYAYLCLPMVWQQVGSISYDAVTLSLVPVILTLFINVFSKKKGFLKDFLKILFIVTITSLVKSGNILFIFLILLFPFSKINKLFFSKRKSFFVKIFLFLFCLFIIWFSMSFNSLGVENNINEVIQKRLLLVDHHYLFQVIFETFDYQIDFYLTSFLGNFGWLDYGLNIFSYFLVFSLLFLVISYFFNSKNKSLIPWKGIIFIYLFVFINIGLIFGSMYLIWTPGGSAVIEGVQGRYFLPLFPFLLLAFAETSLKIGLKKFKLIIIITISVVVFGTLISETYKRYYDYSELYQNSTELSEEYQLISDKNLEFVKVDKQIDMEIEVLDNKFSAVQFITFVGDQKIVVPYGYSLTTLDGRVIKKGYLPVKEITLDGVSQINFSIKEIEPGVKLKFSVYPLIIDDSENYFSLVKEKNSEGFLTNLLYIQK